MNRFIIGVILVIGMFFGSGVGQTKGELDPRLILSPKEKWASSGTGCRQDIYFYAEGTFVYRDICGGDVDTVKGTWHTRNDTLFRQTTYVTNKNGNNYRIGNEAEQYYFEHKNFLMIDNLSGFDRASK